MTNKEEKQKILEQKYMEHQLLGQQIKQLENQLQTIENQIMEINVVGQGIDSLKKTKTGTEILVPVSSGIFLKGGLVNNQKLLINVGAGVVVEKTIEGAKQLLRNQLDELDKLRNQIIAQLQKLTLQASEIENELEKIISESG